MPSNDTPRSDAWELANFMEPMPDKGPSLHGANEYWWKWDWHDGQYCWLPRHMGLTECHLGEEKLSEEQWVNYVIAVATGPWKSLHADAATKLAALAAVIRSTR